ncbi:LTA synthase family protein [Flavobacteriaceae bacterium D16]|nr:LTA synthase family protein [Flavobacteriaceae bacterium D16]
MGLLSQINVQNGKPALKEYIQLAMAFFLALCLLSFYQNVRLYSEGVLDGIISKSLFLSFLHHSGFASLVALMGVFIFNYYKQSKPEKGFQIMRYVFWILLVIEGLLMEFYLQHYEILEFGFWGRYFTFTSVGKFILLLLAYAVAAAIWFHLFYRLTSTVYRVISKMYPFTLILLSLFLATLSTAKKPVNENKTQHLVTAILIEALSWDEYEGTKEYPLTRKFISDDDLGSYMNLTTSKPNIVFIVIDGLGSEFIGDNAVYEGFTPFLNSLAHNSLYWPNHLSNTGENHAALPTIIGSLPFGEDGFTNLENTVTRQTLYGVLKKNGYHTSFYYGGNTALNQLDRFLFEEHVDLVVDQKSFGDRYMRQEEDKAGISLGYPDKELFRNWAAIEKPSMHPRLEVFLSLSSQNPYLIPEGQKYKTRVDELLRKHNYPRHIAKRVRKNKSLFASLLYTDEAVKELITSYSALPEYQHTLFIITGSHNVTELPGHDELHRYKVPLFIYSPMIKKAKRMKPLVSHADITPSLLQMLHKKYGIELPEEVAWLGAGLTGERVFQKQKTIPLYRYGKGIKDFVSGRHFLSGNKLYHLDGSLNLAEEKDKELKDSIRQKLDYFRSVNKYVTQNNKLIPEEYGLFTNLIEPPSPEEQVWINSVFNGQDFDDAYETARNLALDGNRERALLLCRFILNRVPGHIDTEVLMGRIYGWEGQYKKATELLERTVQKYPVYIDAYSALLDTYFWSGQNNKATFLKRKIELHELKSNELKIKLKRAYDILNEQAELSVAQENGKSIAKKYSGGL